MELLFTQARGSTAPGLQVATAVGLHESALTTTHDFQVRVQFPWQRGT